MAKNTLNAQEEQSAVEHVTKHKTNILSSTERLRSIWLQLYKNYRIFKQTSKKDWQSKLWIPKTFTAIEQIASRTTAHNPKFNLRALQSSSLEFFTANQSEIDEAIATNKEIDEGNRDLSPTLVPEAEVMSSKDILEAYLNYVFQEKKLKQKVRLWDKGRLIYGTYHIKIDPTIVTETRKRTVKQDDEEVEIEEEVFKNVIPDIQMLDVFDFLIHPLEESIDSAYGVIHKRDEVSLSELDDGTYFNLDKIQNGSDSPQDLVSQEVQKRNVVVQDATKKIDPDSFTLNEYWGRFSTTGESKDEKEYIITVVNDSILIRFEENKMRDSAGNPIRPFVKMDDQPVPGEYYAVGEAEPIMSLQEEINNIRNQRVDYNNSVLYPEWIVRKGSGINPFQLVHKPNNIVLADNLTDIQPLKKDGVPQSGYNEEDYINRDIQETTSTTQFSDPGASSAFTDTVTGAQIRQQEQNTRMRLKIEYLDDAVAELGRKILLIAANEIQGNIEIPGKDDNFISVYKDAFKKMAEGFSPQVVAGSMAADTPAEKRNEAIARGNISLQYAAQGVPVNLASEYKNIMEDGFNVKDIDSLLGDTTAEPVVQPNQQPIGSPQI
jgi:hypothetical protein